MAEGTLQRYANVTIASGATVSSAYDAGGMGRFAVIIPAAFTGTTLQFQVSADGVTYVPLYDATNTRVTRTVAAGQAYPLPAELATFRSFKLVSGSAEGAARTLVVVANDTDPGGGVAGATGPQAVNATQSGTWVTPSVAGTTLISKPFDLATVTAGTPQAVWTPTTGKKFQLLGWILGVYTGNEVLLKDATTTIARTGPLSANLPPQVAALLAPGLLSAVTNNALNVDVTVTGRVTGLVYGVEV